VEGVQGLADRDTVRWVSTKQQRHNLLGFVRDATPVPLVAHSNVQMYWHVTIGWAGQPFFAAIHPLMKGQAEHMRRNAFFTQRFRTHDCQLSHTFRVKDETE
jgi:hypothetical protein